MEISKETKEEVVKMYSPKNAFGNKELLEKLKIIENLEAEKKARLNCKICNGTGFIKTECPDCDGAGMISVECDHGANEKGV